MTPENKINAPDLNQTSDFPGFNEESKARAIHQAYIQLKEVSASRSWNLVAFYSTLRAIFGKKNVGLIRKLSESLYAAQTFFKKKEPALIRHNDQRSSSEIQKQLFGKEVCRNGRIAVILHLFYADLWKEISDHLKAIDEPFDLFVSIPASQNQVREAIAGDYPQSYLYSCPNRGRDVAPFVEVLSAIREVNYDLICKIHTKKSSHLKDGAEWRAWLFREILGDQKRVAEIIAAFETDPGLGMVTPEGYLYSGIDIHSFINKLWIGKLSEFLSVDVHDFRFDYPAGSMFWCRASALRKLAWSGIRTLDFEPEKGQLNRTLAHGIERMFGVLVMDQGFRLADTGIFPPMLSDSAETTQSD